MKIVVLDGKTLNPGDLSWKGLEELGELIVYEDTKKEEILERMEDAEVIFTNKTPIKKEVLEHAPHLKFIGVLATGYNVVDVEEAKKKGILVSNVPGYGTQAVAQFTMALLLEICNQVAHHSMEVKKGRWGADGGWCFWDTPLLELSGKTMGIIGFGSIGQEVGKLGKAFGMRILAYSRTQKEVGREIAEYVDMDTLLRESDIISLHCPLFPETRKIIDEEKIQKMKEGVILINTSRGPLVDELAVVDALNSRKMRGFGSDVAAREPIEKDNPLLKVRNCFLTPHIAWAAKETREKLMKIAVENLEGYLSGNPRNIVN